MKTLMQTIEQLNINVDKGTLEYYIRQQWVKPAQIEDEYHLSDIDIARIRLICQLQQDLQVEEESMDLVLSLLDQVYGLREEVRLLMDAIGRQPRRIQAEIFSLLSTPPSEELR